MAANDEGSFEWFTPAPSNWLSGGDSGGSSSFLAPTDIGGWAQPPTWSSFMTLPGTEYNLATSPGYDFSVASPEYAHFNLPEVPLSGGFSIGSLWDRMNQPIFSESGTAAQNAGKITPLGALVGLGGTMLDNKMKERAMKEAQKRNNKAAQERLQQQLALRRQAMDATGRGFYNVSTATRTQNATPYSGSGQYQFFTPGQTAWNRTSITPRAAAKGGLMQACSCGKKFAEGGMAVSDEDYARMVAEAQQARREAIMDRPSVLGFLRYMMNGKKMPSEIAASQVTSKTLPGVISDREEELRRVSNYATGGATKGQSDKIPALLSDGEYVIDADVVAALGDGNTAAGAAELDKMREAVRAHKRAAPTSSIPPKAKSPLSYMKKGK